MYETLFGLADIKFGWLWWLVAERGWSGAVWFVSAVVVSTGP